MRTTHLLVCLYAVTMLSLLAKTSEAESLIKSLNQNDACSEKDAQVGIMLHLTQRSDSVHSPKGLANDQVWLKAQLREANLLFSEIDVCFVIAGMMTLPQSESVMKTRAQRTALGRTKNRLHKGLLDLFIVNRLEDVDVSGAEIRGVHWRDPKAREKRRWIILSRIARSKVLAHELGHYFGLPHSEYPESIMNKRRRQTPPMSERGFVKAEHKIMKQKWNEMRRSKHLIEIQSKSTHSSQTMKNP